MQSKKNIAIVTPSLFHEKVSADAIESLKKSGEHLASKECVLLCSLADSEVRWTAEAAQVSGCFGVAFSPAANKKESEEVYRERNPWIDLVIYTGSGDVSHLATMLESADALLLPVFHPVLIPVLEESLRRLTAVTIITQEDKGNVMDQLRKTIDAVLLETATITVTEHLA